MVAKIFREGFERILLAIISTSDLWKREAIGRSPKRISSLFFSKDTVFTKSGLVKTLWRLRGKYSDLLHAALMVDSVNENLQAER